MLPPENRPGSQSTANDGSPYSQAAVGDLPPISGCSVGAPVRAPIRRQVVETPADDACWDSGERHVENHLAVTATCGIASLRPQHRNKNSHEDRQGISADRKTADHPNTLGG